MDGLLEPSPLETWPQIAQMHLMDKYSRPPKQILLIYFSPPFYTQLILIPISEFPFKQQHFCDNLVPSRTREGWLKMRLEIANDVKKQHSVLFMAFWNTDTFSP